MHLMCAIPYIYWFMLFDIYVSLAIYFTSICLYIMDSI